MRMKKDDGKKKETTKKAGWGDNSRDDRKGRKWKRKRKGKKRAERDKDEANRLARIKEDTVSKQFTGSLTSYKRKDDLVVLAGALELSTEGTVAELTLRIKAHLIAHPELASSDWFSGLFGRRRVEHQHQDIVV